ncbi:hypothetical protein ACFFJI_11405 [Allobacillus sp. GCM10007491]|uniref:DUF4352 domain-containing protein n=2 Tax=Allobacillus TaxID=1400133 RepID=A0A941CTE6_9BACI|nr:MULTISPECIES: hypothetical protein [Allobacillus]MBR7553592.1 hypothetical protein [Allobacillus saliphilus]TSJ60346.1 hypothetical protein FPQ13_12085 [Allobacillus salarius]
MKKFLFVLFTLMLTAFLAACGGSDSSEEASAEDSDQEERTESADESDDQQESEESSNEESSESESTEDVIETEGGVFTAHAKNEEKHTFETGPVVLTIEKVVATSGELNEEGQQFFETDEIDYIQVDISVENTSDEDISFYAGQGTVSTNTGEQIEPDMWLSDHIEGEMMAGTKGSGTMAYVLENSNAEDIESIRLVFDAPLNEDWDTIGEDLDFEIELK